MFTDMLKYIFFLKLFISDTGHIDIDGCSCMVISIILGGPGTSIARSTPALPLYHTVNLFMYLRKKIMGGGRDCWVRVILMD